MVFPTASRCLLAAAAAALWASAAHGAILVNDTWIDGTRVDPAAPDYSENGVDTDSDGDKESVWYRGGAGTLDPVGAGGPLRATLPAGGGSSASWTTYLAPEASQVTLQQGETLKITWVFTPSGVNATNTSQGMRVALVNTPGADRLVAEGAPADSTFTGYAMFMNMGQTLGSSSSFRLYERSLLTTGNLLASSGNWAALSPTGAANGAHGYDNGTSYTFVMSLTRTAADALDIAASMTGGTLNDTGLASIAFTDTTPNGGSFTFDTFALRPLSTVTTAEQIDTSLFQVEYIQVPEPATLALVGLAALPIVGRRCRR